MFETTTNVGPLHLTDEVTARDGLEEAVDTLSPVRLRSADEGSEMLYAVARLLDAQGAPNFGAHVRQTAEAVAGVTAEHFYWCGASDTNIKDSEECDRLKSTFLNAFCYRIGR